MLDLESVNKKNLCSVKFWYGEFLGESFLLKTSCHSLGTPFFGEAEALCDLDGF